MKKKIFLIVIAFFLMFITFIKFNKNEYYGIANNKIYLENNSSLTLTAGTYMSTNGYVIVVGDDGTIKYDNTYSLTQNEYTLTGKIGSDSKTVTFYKLNDSNIVSSTAVTYTHNSVTNYLYDGTVFSKDKTPTSSQTGQYELWSNGTLLNRYDDLQSAVDASSDYDTIKITEDIVVSEGTYIDKNITIDGNNHVFDRSTWTNAVFVIDQDVTVTITNLTIDGGASGFEIDFDAVTYLDYNIPLKSGSLDNDPRLNQSAIISRGNLTINNVKINNNYTSSYGGAINVYAGTLVLNESEFNHNLGNTYGAAISIGSKMLDLTEYPVKKVIVNNCDFIGNYGANTNNLNKLSSGYGPAMDIYNTEKIEINGSLFKDNAAHYGKGGAINLRDETTTNTRAEELGLDFYQVTITDSLFENNWAGNDGFAIQTYAAELNIKDSTFKNNVGIHPTSSVGTISVEAYRKTGDMITIINNTLFEKNSGPASVFGDHSTQFSQLKITNCTFKENIGNETLLIYSSVSEIENTKFIDENVGLTVVDARIYENYPTPPSLKIKNTIFDGTKNGTDVLVRKNKHDETLNTYNVTFEGTNVANVDVWDNNAVFFKGTHTGNVETDGSTLIENIIIEKGAKFNGEIIDNSNTNTIIITYPVDDDKKTANEVVYVSKDITTIKEEEFYLYHQVSKEGYKLEYYTDNSYTTAWDYSNIGHLTLYANWVEHVHEYTNTLISYKNGIYEQCTCGHLGKGITIKPPTNLKYNGDNKPVIINNDFEKNDYVLKYQKLSNGVYNDISEEPKEVGTYKAILTYNNLEAELQYEIVEEINNPKTFDWNSKLYMIIILITIICIGLMVTIIVKSDNTHIEL